MPFRLQVRRLSLGDDESQDQSGPADRHGQDVAGCRRRVPMPCDGAGDRQRVLPGSGDRAAGRRPVAPRADTRGGGVLRAGGRAPLLQRRRTDLGSSGQVSECPEGSTTPLRNESTATARMLVFFTPAGTERRGKRVAIRNQPPAGAGQLHSVTNQVPARAFDDIGGDGTARREVVVVLQIRRVLQRVVRARVDRLAGVARQAGDGRRTPHRRRHERPPPRLRSSAAVIPCAPEPAWRTPARAIRGQPHQAARLVDARLTASRRALPIGPPQVTVVAPATNREGSPVAHCAPSHSAAGQSGASPATARSAMHRNSARELPPLNNTLPSSSASR